MHYQVIHQQREISSCPVKSPCFLCRVFLKLDRTRPKLCGFSRNGVPHGVGEIYVWPFLLGGPKFRRT